MGSWFFYQTCTKPYARAASYLLPSRQLHFPNIFTLSPISLHKPKHSLDFSFLTVQSTPKQPTLPTQPASMASSSQRSFSTDKCTQMTARASQPEAYPSAQSAQFPGMGFDSMPSLPIILVPFKFLSN